MRTRAPSSVTFNQNIPKTTGGSSTAFTLSYSTAPGALVDGMTHLVQFNAANGLAPTLNVNSLGGTPLHYYSAGAWRAIPTGLIDANETWRVAYNGSVGEYRLLDLRNRTGEIVPFGGSTAPAGALLCYGQAVSRTDYVGLFTVIGTTYGVGDGTTTFNLPDLRGRVVAGQDDMGGSSANRLTNQSGGVDGDTLGAVGGAETHQLTAAELALHSHGLGLAVQVNAGSNYTVPSAGANSYDSLNAGGNTATTTCSRRSSSTTSSASDSRGA